MRSPLMRNLLAIFLFVSAISLPLAADPLVVRGADGSYLPLLAEEWRAVKNGVFLKIRKGIDLGTLKDRLIEKFPEQTVEIRNEQIFFASIDEDALLHLIAGVDVGIAFPQKPLAVLREKKDLPDNLFLPPEQRAKKMLGEFIEAEIISLSFSGIDGLVKAEVMIKATPTSGEFAKLKGAIKIKAFFKMKKKRVDVEDESNLRKSDLLIVQPKSLIYLRLEKKDTDEAYLVSEAHLKKY